MRRRNFFKMLALAPFGAAVRAKEWPELPPFKGVYEVNAWEIKSIGSPVGNITADTIENEPIYYTDSDNNDPATLTPLADGGASVSYQP